MGSSTGHTRVYRQCYEESPEYVPLVREAGRQFKEMEKEMKADLLREIGCVTVAPKDGKLLKNTELAAKMFDLPYTTYSREEWLEKYPQFRVRKGEAVLVDHSAGIIFPEDSVKTFLKHAEKNGANILE